MQQNIKVSAYNRPIKIAYILPTEESEDNHWIIDAIFHESYTRWGGARTLIIPSLLTKFLHKEYEGWLQAYDADIVYSYVDLEKQLIEKINKLCCPIALIKHKFHNKNGKAEGWRDYLPDFGRLLISPTLSITTLFSRNRNVPTLLVENRKLSDSDKRILADNFGTSHSTMQGTHAIPDLYEIHEPDSLISAFVELVGGKVITFSDLAMRHSKACKLAESFDLGETLHLFIGETCKDRINFWNARNLMPETIGIGTLMVNRSWISNKTFLQVLCNSRIVRNVKRISLKSLSLTKEELEQIRDQFGNGTIVEGSFDKHYLPKESDFRNLSSSAFIDENSFVLREAQNEVVAIEPEHFLYLPNLTHGSYLRNGQWAVELAIDRQNNLSKFYRETDKWELPRRWEVARLFTTNSNTKISRHNLLTVIPNKDRQLFQGNRLKSESRYGLNLPDDSDVFRALVCKYALQYQLPEDDLRYNSSTEFYKEIKISDKGQNLRGVISMFRDLNQAYGILTNKFWSKTLIKITKPRAKSEAMEGVQSDGKKSRMTFDKMLPSALIKGVEYAAYKEMLKKSLRITKVGKYLEENFKDTLEYLVEREIFYQVYEHRCEYCGHRSVLTIDEIKKENECSICRTKFFSPIDPEWTFKLNEFVSNSLMRHSGFATLWTIGFLHDNPYFFTKHETDPIRTSFYYLPEADLFLDENGKKEEIDVLCVVGGKFCAGEAKTSALQFLDQESGEINSSVVDKFVKKINLIKPDIALLSFLTFCDEESARLEMVKAKIPEIENLIQSQIGDTKLQILIAEKNDRNFGQYPVDLGCIGKRTQMILEKEHQATKTN